MKSNIDDIDEKIHLLEQMKKIDTAAALKKVKRKIQFTSVLTKGVIYWERIAAVLAIPVIGFLSFLLMRDSDATSMVTAFSSYGTISEIVLPDNSVVKLNSGSTLSYPVKFSKNDGRVVSLDGEAYFKVASNKENPFIVKCNDLEIKALGTEFNVLGRKNGDVVTSLVNGVVELYDSEKDYDFPIRTMSPRQTVHYHAENDYFSVDKEDEVERYTSWMDGILHFRNDSLPTVLESLERFYGIKFNVQIADISRYSYTGTFRNMKLDRLLEYLEYTTPIKISYQGVVNGEVCYSVTSNR